MKLDDGYLGDDRSRAAFLDAPRVAHVAGLGLDLGRLRRVGVHARVGRVAGLSLDLGNDPRVGLKSEGGIARAGAARASRQSLQRCRRPVLADASSALLALASHPPVLADASSPHSLHSLRTLPCSQMREPPPPCTAWLPPVLADPFPRALLAKYPPCPSRAGTTDLAVPSPPPSAFACQDSSACRRAFARSVVLAERNDESTAGLSVLFSSDPTTHDPNNARFFRARASHRPTRPRSSLRLTRSRASSMRGRRGPLVTPSVAELGDSLPGDDLRADIPSTWRADLATAAASAATEPVATSETRCVPTRVPAPRLIARAR